MRLLRPDDDVQAVTVSAPWVVGFSLLWVVVVLNTVTVSGLVRRVLPLVEHFLNADASSAMHPRALTDGRRVPEFELIATTGQVVSPQKLRGTPWIIFFTRGHCAPCLTFAQILRDAASDIRFPLIVALVSGVDAPALDLPEQVLTVIDEDARVQELFESDVTPHGFAVDAHGYVIASRIPSDRSRFSELIGEANAVSDIDPASRGEVLEIAEVR